MLSCVVSLWMAAVVVGQQAPEAGWLKSVPADIPVVARIRALEDVKGDLLAMLKAMSPTGADIADGAVEPALQAFTGMYGQEAAKHPFLVMMRLPDPAQPDLSAWAVIVQTGDAAAVIKGLSQQGAEKPKTLDGHESFTAQDGQTWYAAKGTGWVAFGPNEDMIKAIHKPKSSLATVLPVEVKARFLAGDVGLYLNIAAVQTQYGDVIEQARPAIMAQLEQAPNAGGAQNIESLKSALNALTEGLKVGDHLALSLDFSAEGLTVSSLATVKAGTPAAKSLAEARTGSGTLLARLPADKMFYIFGANPHPPEPDQKAGAAAPSPALKKATAARLDALDGRLVMGISIFPMQVVSLADPQDPGAAVAATLEASKARPATEKVTVKPDAVTQGSFHLARVTTAVDPKTLVAQARKAVPNSDEIIKKMFTGNAVTTYTGTDGKLFVEVNAATDDEAKAQVAAIVDSSRGLGHLPAWKALRPKFPERTTWLVLINAQEAVKMFVSGIGMATNKPDIKPPADLPKSPALLGFSVVSSPTGYDLRLIIPSNVGPVFEKGFAPLGDIE